MHQLWHGQGQDHHRREHRMGTPTQPLDFSSLTPVQRIALADALYDSAMREIDAMTPHLSPEQLAEIDRSIADVEAGRVDLLPRDDVYARLMPNR